jgi:hypothetical protein
MIGWFAKERQMSVSVPESLRYRDGQYSPAVATARNGGAITVR